MKKRILYVFVCSLIGSFLDCNSPSDQLGMARGKIIMGVVTDSITGGALATVKLMLGSINDSTYQAGPEITDTLGRYFMFVGGGGGHDSFLEASKEGYESRRVFYFDGLANRDTIVIDFLMSPL